MKNLQLVWTKYGNNLALGIRYKGKDKSLIEQIYTLFYNYGITNGAFYIMNDGKFGYFLLKEERLKKIHRINTDFAKSISRLIKKDFIQEDFLNYYLLEKVNLVAV